MSFLQAILYFFREALTNLARGWKVSLVAVLTIAVSLFVGGAFVLVSSSLLASVERWRGEMRLVIYLQPGTPDPLVRQLAAEAGRGPGVASVAEVSAEAARRRFQEAFPSLSDLVEGLGDEPLPPSLELSLTDPARRPPELRAWIETWRRRSEVSMVDDDREWLGQLETVVAVLRAVGLALGVGLLAAAVFTIGSVVRLTAYLHSDEISVLRLVGATEFYIRGPFYTEGFLQGLLGGLLASGTLWAGEALLRLRNPDALLTRVLVADLLTPGKAAALIGLGAAAGLAGAVASLRRERLTVSEEAPPAP
ncbi:MAG TPA: permease-like cell division protein FtsX [Thermoanaerobaculia bacterium]|nr:permease-like cell division protein FtsX [Thermoanaerobaculia bacterium]